MKDPTDARFQRQHGVLSRAQAREDGLTLAQIRVRATQGPWIVVSPGVFRHRAFAVTPEQRILAACLAGGPLAVASHQSAAWLWDLSDRRAGLARGAITVGRDQRPRSYGFDVHRSNDLDWSRVLVHKGIPCTDPLRTLVDLAAVIEGTALDDAIDRALSRRLVSVAGLAQELERLGRPGRRGVGLMRDQLSRRGYLGAPHPSVLESRGLTFLRRYRLPVAGAEVIAGPEGEYRVDFCLVDPVMLELDGYVWHYSPEHQARDHERRNQLKLSGVDLYVSNWLELYRHPDRLARTLRQALAQARPAAAVTRR